MWEKTWGAICDQCGSGIDYYIGFTKKQAIATALSSEETRITTYKGREFCGGECLAEYKAIVEGK